MSKITSNEHIQTPYCSYCGSTRMTLYHINDNLTYLCQHCLLEIGKKYANEHPEKFNKNRKQELHG